MFFDRIMKKVWIATLLTGALALGGFSFAADKAEQITICAVIAHDNSAGIETLTVSPYGTIGSADESIKTDWSSNGNCLTINTDWLTNETSNGIGLKIEGKDANGKTYLLEMRDKNMFSDAWMMKKVNLYYDIFVLDGGDHAILVGAVGNETDYYKDGTQSSQRKYDWYASNQALISPVLALQWIEATKYGIADFMAESTLTREQAAKFFVQTALKIGLTGGQSTADKKFTDGSQIDPTLYSYVQTATRMGIMGQGNGGAFRPKSAVTYGEATAILVRMKYGKLDESQAPWYRNYFDKAYDMKLFDSFAYNPHPILDGNLPLSRAMVGFMISTMLLNTYGLEMPNTYGY